MSCGQTADCRRCHPRYGTCQLLDGHKGQHWNKGCGANKPPTREQGPICRQLGPCFCDDEEY
jgi:hypothetical protein